MNPAQIKPNRRRPAERPAEILKAAELVFIQRGYERATTREIAAQAGVSEGTLYNYFSSKREILLTLFDMTHESLRRDIEDIQAENLEDALVRFLTHRLYFSKEHPLMILILQQAMQDPEVGRYLDKIIAEGQEQIMNRFRALFEAGVMRPVDPFVAEEALGSMLMGLTIGVELASRGWHREPLPPEEIARALVDVLMNGLRVPPKKENSDDRPNNPWRFP